MVVLDGQRQQLYDVEQVAARYRNDLIVVLDFIHVLEYLWRAAHCFHAPGSEAAEQWVGERAEHILQGKSSAVAAGMRRSATRQGLSAYAREAVDACADYLLNYRDYLHYDRYLTEGLPIASGVIEGACRHLVKDRMDLTGARWGLARAEAVLKLRALQASGDFQAYWNFHTRQELMRNHPDYVLARAA